MIMHFIQGGQPARGATQLTGHNPCYAVYETRDGKYVTVGALEGHFWRNLCEQLGVPDFVPDQFAEVVRPAEVKVRYLDENGARRELHAKGVMAVCLQHEMDHLEGVLFVDHISALRRNMILRKLQKAKKLKQPVPA